MPRHGLGAENPINDGAQVVFVLVFLIIWGLDSFLLRFGLNQLGLISLFVSIPIGVISFIILKGLDVTIGLRVSPQDETEGLDITQHGEQGYNF
jgi:hypothetical protein